MKRHEALAVAALDSLRPSKRFEALISQRRARIRALTGGAPAYNLVHLRLEADWFAQCETWQDWQAGRDNCMNNTLTVGDELRKDGFEPKVGGGGGGARGGAEWSCSSASWVGGGGTAGNRGLLHHRDSSRGSAVC